MDPTEREFGHAVNDSLPGAAQGDNCWGYTLLAGALKCSLAGTGRGDAPPAPGAKRRSNVRFR